MYRKRKSGGGQGGMKRHGNRSESRSDSGQAGHARSRNGDRRFFDALTTNNDSSLHSAQGAKRLFNAALGFAASEGAPALLYRLNESAGSSALRKGLEYITESFLFEEGFLPLLERLAREDLNKPVYEIPMNSLILKLYELPFLVSSIRSLIAEWIPRGQNEKRTALAWFFAKIALENDQARKNEDIIAIAEELTKVGCGRHLQTVLGGNKVKVSISEILDTQMASAGGRHDNDKEDFRSITIVPTCQEFLSDADPYLPKPSEDESATEASVLDRHFRLLREDLIGPSKAEKDDPKKQQRDIFYEVRPVAIETGAAVYEQRQEGKPGVRVSGETDPCIMFELRLPSWFRVNFMKSYIEKKDYWEKNRRILPRDALICLERRNEQGNWTPVRFGTIVRREIQDLVCNQPEIGISFASRTDFEDTLMELSDSSIPPTRLVMVSADLFAYQPILRGLQMMSEIPFKDEIVHAKQSLPADGSPIEIPSSMKERVDRLNSGQRQALDIALNARLSLIQGPPGTGKSFIGVLLTEILLSSTNHIVLVLTYTNHALDEILEDLLDHDITKIVRIGGRSRNERLTQYNLRQLGAKLPFSQEQTRWYAKLKQAIEDAEHDVNRLGDVLPEENRDNCWWTVEPLLWSRHPGAWNQLSVPQNFFGCFDKDHLYKSWLENKHLPYFFREKARGNLWDLSPKGRQQLRLEWHHEIEDARKDLALAFMTLKNARKELKGLQHEKDVRVLSNARVIGCTTTKAAMCKSLLNGVGARIMLVEEAAEIREADVLTSLSPSATRLIMIGDHQQLRPKCQYYPLTVESGLGFDLNRSLFERLALAPSSRIATLGVQHRMHPDISSIPKLVTYTDLQNAPTVSAHPKALGLQSRVVFINHNVLEDNDKNCDSLQSVSKTNIHERSMILSSVQYLLQQGYAPDDIVVLTPYLGQMMKLQAELGKHLDVSLDDRDLNDAHAQLRSNSDFSSELVTAKRARLKLNAMSSIRVATIDNYQGEEAKVVLISLVRSNTSGQIGFLKEPERVNVMFSRARDCEIIIGNRATFEQAKGSLVPLRGGSLWKKIFSHLESSGYIYDGLPAACQNHSSRVVLKCPADFEIHCRHGGCMRKCQRERDCAHPCHMFCHTGPCPKCRVMVPDKCIRGHHLKRQCSADTLPECSELITWTCPLGHIASGPCFEGKFGSECKICIALEQEEEHRRAREKELNQLLLEKQETLSKLKNKVEMARQSNAHQQELKSIELELTLAQNTLDGYIPSEEAADPISAHEENFQGCTPNTLTKNVLTLLRGREAVSLCRFPARYKDKFGSVFAEDAEECMPPTSKKRRLKEILESIPFCEVLPDSSGQKRNHFDVRLRNDDMRDAKRRKLFKSPETTENTSKSPVTDRDQHLKYGIDSEWPHPPPNKAPTRDLVTTSAESILPTTSTKINSTVQAPEKCDETIVHVIQRYIAEGPLKADDLLDEMPTESQHVVALRFMMELELNPGGILRAPEYKPGRSKLINAICLTAKAMDTQIRFPLQAREFAQTALALIGDGFVGPIFPVNWVNDLKAVGQSVLATKHSANSESIHRGKSLSESWLEIKRTDQKAPAVISDSILPMIGLEAVKESLVGMYHRFKLAQEQGDGAASSYNVRFEGNPGVGKTTIARHYALFLQQLVILPEGSVIQETNGAKLIQGGVKGLQDLLDDVKENGGGVIFVDEAYQLASDREGKKVLDFMLPLAESLDTEYGPLVWIFAGYKKPIERLFEHNEGLPSRFPLRFIFEDFSDVELHDIFRDMMQFMPPQQKSSSKDSNSKEKIPPHQNRQNNNYAHLGYRGRGAAGQAKVCQFGLTWKYVSPSLGTDISMCGWIDKYNNRTVDPEHVGKSSKLVDEKGCMWEMDDGSNLWKSDGDVIQGHYPGSPAPIKSTKTIKRDPPFHCDEQHLGLSIKRLGRGRDERGFGNARAVRLLFEKVRDRQAIRIAKNRTKNMATDIFHFSKHDLLGPEVTADSLKKSMAWADLDNMEGLVPVKDSVKQLFNLVLRNAEREKRGEEPLDVSLNRLFLGNPGTGKTTVAAIYGQILSDLGLLSKGEVILKVASDFLGETLGSSEKTTQGILNSAEGCVLVIDEAYSLYTGGSTGSGTNNPYKTAVIDTIVEKVQAKPGSDIAVLMIGYQEEMENMMSHVNPGLSRRFQVDEAFHFPDFDDASLLRIMMASAEKRGVKLGLGVGKRAVRTLARSRAKPHFGNAGAVQNLLSKGIVQMQAREQQDDKLVLEDFDYNGDGPDATTLDSLFDDMIGCKAVKEAMTELKSTVLFSHAQGKDAAASGIGYNFLFLGSPGTGKTITARKMGRMFYALGLLPGDDMLEAKASDFVTGYTGQAGKCTRELLRKSLGGVLFIDEAYQMDPTRGGVYMTEAADELVGALTEKQFKGKLLVILAGYDRDMEKMLNTNPGLKSRFSERIHFEDFNAEAVSELLVVKLKQSDVPLESKCEQTLLKLSKRLIDESGLSFGNGRDVDVWANYVYKVVAKKFTHQPKSSCGGIASFHSTLKDIEVALDQILESRKERTGGQSCVPFQQDGNSLEATSQMHKDPPPVAKLAHKTKVNHQEAEVEAEEASEYLSESSDPPSNIFDSIGADVLKTLQNFIEEQGLGSEAGAKHLSGITPDSKAFGDLVSRLQKDTGLSFAKASAKLLEWQSLQEDLEAMIEQEKQKTKTLGARPIWRCGVCGRADKPWIACYVAPFIVRYEKVPLEGE